MATRGKAAPRQNRARGTAVLTVHHLNNSRSQRVLWLLEELGVAYEVKRYERDAKTMFAPAALRQVHFLGKSPVITDDRRTIAESGAIIEYLVRQYGRGELLPAMGSEAYDRYIYWLHYAEGSAMTPLLLKLIFTRIETAPMPFFVRPVARGIVRQVNRSFIDPQIKLHLDYMELALEEHAWFAGDEFSAADIQMSFPLEAASSRGGLDASRPKLLGFLQRIHARPAYQRAIEVGGPYDYAT